MFVLRFWANHRVNEWSFEGQILLDSVFILGLKLQFQILISLAEVRIRPEKIAKSEHSGNLPMPGRTDVNLVRPHPIYVTPIKMVVR